MKVARTESEKSVGDIAARLYGIKPSDSRAAEVAKALVAANPQLKDPAKLPAGTPLLVPEIAGLRAAGTSLADPKQPMWTGVLDKLLDSARQASNAQSTGKAAAEGRTGQDPRAEALKRLENDIAQFRKLHSS